MRPSLSRSKTRGRRLVPWRQPWRPTAAMSLSTRESVDALGRRSVTTKVRIPFTRFDSSLQQIESLGKVLDKQITAEDVTEEFVDSQAKLRNLQRTELCLLAHLDHTGRLPDIL